MLKKIGTTGAYYGGGLSTQRRIFIVPSGAYQGRAIVIYPESSSQLVFVWSDPPYTTWSQASTIASDSADYPACAFMDDNANVYVAYTQLGSLALVETKLTFSDGVWQVGSMNTVYDSDANYFPSLFKDSFGRLWLSFTKYIGGQYYVSFKRSSDDGVTWGSGSSDPGTELTSGSTSAYSQLVFRPNHVYCLYTYGGETLGYRRRNLTAAFFDDEVTLYSGTGLGANFCGATSDDLRIGVVFCDQGNVYYKEYDGAQWSGIATVHDSYSIDPSLYFRRDVPYVIFAAEIGDDQQQPYVSYSEGGEFVEPVPISPEISKFEKVLCYSPTAAVEFVDRSTAAGDDSPADIYHDESGCLLLASGDAVFIGQSERYSMVSVRLSTIGSGGQVSWYYWNGSNWTAFTPSSGSFNFDTASAVVRLWDDTADIPSDWQSSVVNNEAKYWIKAVAAQDFSTGPVGTQITGAANITHIVPE
jgi:hypothetical protein